MDHRKVPRQQIVAHNGRGSGAIASGKGKERLLEVLRTHVTGRCVDQIAGQKLALGHRQQGFAIQPIGQLQARLFRLCLGRAIPVEPIACQKPGQRRFFCISLGQVTGKMP